MKSIFYSEYWKRPVCIWYNLTPLSPFWFISTDLNQIIHLIQIHSYILIQVKQSKDREVKNRNRKTFLIYVNGKSIITE